MCTCTSWTANRRGWWPTSRWRTRGAAPPSRTGYGGSSRGSARRCPAATWPVTPEPRPRRCSSCLVHRTQKVLAPPALTDRPANRFASKAITRRAPFQSGLPAAQVASQALRTASNTPGSTAPAARRRSTTPATTASSQARHRRVRAAQRTIAPSPRTWPPPRYPPQPTPPAATRNRYRRPCRRRGSTITETPRTPRPDHCRPRPRPSQSLASSQEQGTIQQQARRTPRITDDFKTPPRSRERHACAPLHPPHRRVVTTPRRKPKNEIALKRPSRHCVTQTSRTMM